MVADDLHERRLSGGTSGASDQLPSQLNKGAFEAVYSAA
jgi:hypothetical protein